MSSFLFSASITLILLSILPLSIAHPLDTDGDPILNGRDYYIIPIYPVPYISTRPTGVTYTQKREECPLYITLEKTENSPGTPVKISTPINSIVIDLDLPLNLAFKGPTPCDKSPSWRTTLDPLSQKFYITTGSEFTLPFGMPFSITMREISGHALYELKYWATNREEDSLNVGLHKDGHLGITTYPTIVIFKKAFNVLELSTSGK